MAADLNGVTVLLQELDRELERCGNRIQLNGSTEVEVQRFIDLAASVTGNLALTLRHALQNVGAREPKVKPPKELEAAITVKEVATLLRVSASKIQTLVALDEIPHIRHGRRILFFPSRIEKWINESMRGGKK